MSDDGATCFCCGIVQEKLAHESEDEFLRRILWGKIRIERLGGSYVEDLVCPSCVGLLLDPDVVGVKQDAKKTGSGGAHVNIRPGKMVGYPVICLYVPPTKKVKE